MKKKIIPDERNFLSYGDAKNEPSEFIAMYGHESSAESIITKQHRQIHREDCTSFRVSTSICSRITTLSASFDALGANGVRCSTRAPHSHELRCFKDALRKRDKDFVVDHVV